MRGHIHTRPREKRAESLGSTRTRRVRLKAVEEDVIRPRPGQCRDGHQGGDRRGQGAAAAGDARLRAVQRPAHTARPGVLGGRSVLVFFFS